MSTMLDVSTALSSGAAARLLGISKQYLFVLEEKGDLQSARTSIGRLYDRAQVEKLAAERNVRDAA